MKTSALRQQVIDKQDPDRLEIVVCHGTGCMANGSPMVTSAFKTALKSSEPIHTEEEIPFYNLQERIVLHNIGKIDPSDINDTIAAGGYQALAKVLTTITEDL